MTVLLLMLIALPAQAENVFNTLAGVEITLAAWLLVTLWDVQRERRE